MQGRRCPPACLWAPCLAEGRGRRGQGPPPPARRCPSAPFGRSPLRTPSPPDLLPSSSPGTAAVPPLQEWGRVPRTAVTWKQRHGPRALRRRHCGSSSALISEPVVVLGPRGLHAGSHGGGELSSGQGCCPSLPHSPLRSSVASSSQYMEAPLAPDAVGVCHVHDGVPTRVLTYVHQHAVGEPGSQKTQK